jgi:transcriptional regulator with XRE-family HTH domain
LSDIDTLCQRLRELRSRHGLTQEEFSQIAGMSYKHYQQIESGRKKQVWLETVGRLATAYGLETWELIGAELPKDTELAKPVVDSRVHNKMR